MEGINNINKKNINMKKIIIEDKWAQSLINTMKTYSPISLCVTHR